MPPLSQEFDKVRFCSILLVIVLTCGAASAEKINFKSLGVSVEKPNNWHYVTPSAFRANFSKINTKDPEFQKFIQKNASTPFIAFTKFREPHNDLNPSFRISVRPLLSPENFNAIELMNTIILQLTKMHPDLRTERGPMQAEFGGLTAAYFKASFTVSASGREFRTISEIWIARRDNEAFIGGASRSAGPNAIGEAEIARIVSSVRIEP